MKKILFAIAIVMMLGATANAQHGRDALFTYDNIDRGEGDGFNDLVFPGEHNLDTNPDAAPLGSGILVLTALGAGYAIARTKK